MPVLRTLGNVPEDINVFDTFEALIREPGIHLPSLPLSDPKTSSLVLESPMIFVKFKLYGARERNVKLYLVELDVTSDTI